MTQAAHRGGEPREDFFEAGPGGGSDGDSGRPSTAWEAVGWVVFLWALLLTPAVLWAAYDRVFFR